MYLAEDRVSNPTHFYTLLLFTIVVRSCAGNLSRNAVDLGFCTTSNRLMPSPTFLIRCVSCLTDVGVVKLTGNCQVPELISQRRRWLNGSFFAAVHSTVHFHYIYRSSHSFLRKFWIHVEMVYQLFNLIFSWFALVSFILVSLSRPLPRTNVNTG